MRDKIRKKVRAKSKARHRKIEDDQQRKADDEHVKFFSDLADEVRRERPRKTGDSKDSK